MSLRKKKQKRASTIRSGELATKERRHQLGGVIEEVVDRDNNGRVMMKRHRARIACPLDDYFMRKCITEAQCRAGKKFQPIYARAVLNIKIEDEGSGAHGDPEMALLTIPISRQALGKAYAVLSPAQKAAVIKACGHDEYLGDKDLIQTLRRGLERLAMLWNFI